MAWSKGLSVEVGGYGIVSHVGTAALRLLANQVGLTGALSGVVAGTRLFLVHDRGRVFTDLVVMIADGGTTISGIGTLGDQDELFGVVASVSTAWPTLKEVTRR